MREEELLNEFINKYDANNNLGFDTVNYRKGAAITDRFGLAEGFKILDNGALSWGYVRIHTGVDRASGGKLNGIENVVISPFDFESSRFEDYKGEVYGTLVVLISEKFSFEFRIAHMYPEKILILNDLKNNKPITRDTIIGSAGNYGISGGIHTHTEVKSLEEKSPVLEKLLEKKFGIDIEKEYKPEEIIAFYKTMVNFKNSSYDEVFNNWEEQKETRKCFFINKYLYRYVDFDGKNKTRYSTELLWNGL